jgi:hypothetical protein
LELSTTNITCVQREYYETTGKITRSAGEDFMDKFRGGLVLYDRVLLQ